MRKFTSTQAKQNFGALLEAAAQAPVGIEKHGKVKAIVASPAFVRAPDRDLAERRLARERQASLERDRLIRHQRIAIDLLLMADAERTESIARARAAVDRWEAEGLCSRDYIDRWRLLLDLPIGPMARQMTSGADGWGQALRQNSPWTEVMR